MSATITTGHARRSLIRAAVRSYWYSLKAREELEGRPQFMNACGFIECFQQMIHEVCAKAGIDFDAEFDRFPIDQLPKEEVLCVSTNR